MANYVFNSSLSGETYNAKCLNVSDDSEWTPSVAEYPQDGTIDLSGGTSGRYLDTQWVAPQNSEWTMSGIYNVVMGVSYDVYSIHYKGNQTCDIYLGSSTEDLVLSESDKDYTPPTGNWIIEEEPPSIIIPAASLGPNLYTNGYFEGNIDGWSSGNAAVTLAYATGDFMDITTTNTANSSLWFSSGNPALEDGKTYRVIVKIEANSEPADAKLRIYINGFLLDFSEIGIATVDFVSGPTTVIHRGYIVNDNPGGAVIRVSQYTIQEVL